MTYDPRLVELARPFPDTYIHKNPSGGGSYVKHHVIEQRLIHVLGFPPDFELVQIVRGDVAEIPADPQGSSKRAKEGRPALTNAVVGVVARMTVRLGDETRVEEEAGDCEDPHNWPHDGGRLKDAMSDAYKRCAMRLGCGLHLWSQDEYFLYDQLLRAQPSKGGDSQSPGEGTPSHSPKDIGASAPPDSLQGSSSDTTAAPDETRQDQRTVAPSDAAQQSSTAPATSPQEDPEKGEPGAGSSSWEQIAQWAGSDRSRQNKALGKAVTIASKPEHKAIPAQGLYWSNLKDLPAAVLSELKSELGLTQEALSV